MKKKILILTAIFMILIISTATGARKYRIGVFFGYESPNNTTAFEGIKDGFNQAGIDYEFDIQRAYSDDAEADRIVKNWIKQKPDLIYSLGTGSTKTLMKTIKDTPIVFTAVTNPVQSGITPSWETSGRNIAGNSNWIPTEEVLRDFRKVVPTLKTLGVTYDPDNPVSSMEVKQAQKIIKYLQLKLIPVEIKSVNELTAAMKSLVAQKVDAIWICIDKLTYKNMDKVKAITYPAKIPLLASSHRGVKDGAIAGMVVNYRELGRVSVAIALNILINNVEPKDISVWTMKTHKNIVNLKASREIDYVIPDSVITGADQVLR